MTQPPSGPPAPPPGYRPRPRWFVVGALLIVLAAATFGGGLWLVLGPLLREDAVITAGEGPVEVDLPAGEERALFTRDGEPVSCTATDVDGEPVELRRVSADFTTGDWTADLRFDTGAGDVTFDCASPPAAGPASEVRIGRVPSMRAFVGGLLVAVLGPIVLGLAGLVVLVVTGILYVVRPPRPREVAG